MKSHKKQLQDLQAHLEEAQSYDEWRQIAAQIDQHTGAAKWQQQDSTRLYDYKQIRHRLDILQRHRTKGDNHALLYTLNEGIHGNMGGMGKSALYEPALLGTKQLIMEYVEVVAEALQHIAGLSNRVISREEKLDFFHRASHCYGRSALMLSGGGALGHFHIGVVKALLEQDVLPNVISGASAGSLVAAVVGTHTDQQLLDLQHHDAMAVEARQEAKWLNKLLFGTASQIEVGDLEAIVERVVPDMTFQEAYELTGRSINISIAPADLHQTSRLLNAIASPNVYIRKAVMASCAVPGVYPPVKLEARNVHGKRQDYLPTRRWLDGSVSDDLPAKRLSRLYGVNHYIGSLINPLILLSPSGATNPSRLPPLARRFLQTAANSVASSGSRVSNTYTRNWPRFNLLVNMLSSVLNQKYSADISVYADFRSFDLRKILSHLSEDELLTLERQGELAAWRVMEHIRISSTISRTLDDILEAYGEDELRHAALKRKKQREKLGKRNDKRVA